MKLTPPGLFAWLVAVALGGSGIAAKLGFLAAATPYMFWLVATGFIVLVLATLIRGM